MPLDNNPEQAKADALERELRTKIDFLISEEKRRQAEWQAAGNTTDLLEMIKDEKGRVFLMRGNQELHKFLDFIADNAENLAKPKKENQRQPPFGRENRGRVSSCKTCSTHF